MRICIVTFFYSPAGGGIPRYVETIAKEFSRRGHHVDILTASYTGEEKKENQGNLTTYWLPCMNIFKKNEDNSKKAKEFLNFLKRYMHKKPDIFSAQNLHAATRALGHSLALNIISMEYNIPMALTIHSFIQEDEFRTTKSLMIKELMWDKLICVGRNLAESLFNSGILSDRLSIVYPPVDTEVFKAGLGRKWLRSRIGVSDADFLLLHASRIDSIKVAEEKGVFTLLKAMSQLKKMKIKLLISAAPTAPTFEDSKIEAIEKIKSTCKLYGIEKDTIIKTFEPEEMPLVYNGADLFALASQMESFGLVYAEAMACGVPVIGTSVGGVPEVIDNGKSGELIPPDNYVELAKQIDSLAKTKSKMEQMSKYGAKYVSEKLSVGKIGKNLIGLYESIIGKKTGAGRFELIREIITE